MRSGDRAYSCAREGERANTRVCGSAVLRARVCAWDLESSSLCRRERVEAGAGARTRPPPRGRRKCTRSFFARSRLAGTVLFSFFAVPFFSRQANGARASSPFLPGGNAGISARRRTVAKNRPYRGFTAAETTISGIGPRIIIGRPSPPSHTDSSRSFFRFHGGPLPFWSASENWPS